MKKMKKFEVNHYGSFSTIYVDADKDTIGKIAEFVAKLNNEEEN